MTARRKSLSRDAILAIRDDYAAGELTTDIICKRYGIGPDKLCFWVDGGEAEGELHFTPLPRRRGKPVAGARQRRFSGRRVAVVRRLWRTAEAQVFEIEQRLITDQQQPDQQERDARTLAVLAKTLRDLAALDEAKQGVTSTAGSTTGNSTAYDESAPRDVDELRRSLARKLDALIAEQQAGVLGEVE